MRLRKRSLLLAGTALIALGCVIAVGSDFGRRTLDLVPGVPGPSVQPAMTATVTGETLADKAKSHNHGPADSLAGLPTPTPTARPALGSGPIRYTIFGRSPRVNREVTGEVTHELHGIPARPVDSFVWDGEGSTPVDGELLLSSDPVTEQGVLQANWKDKHGDWTYEQFTHYHPHHASGIRFGTSKSSRDIMLNEAAIANVFLHGDTTAGLPVLPTVYTYLGLWGKGTSYLNGSEFPNVYGLPSPYWDGHLMATIGARQSDGTVRTLDGGFYSPAQGANGMLTNDDMEVHLTWHDERFPMAPGNFPPIFDFFYHLVFEDVMMQIVQIDTIGGPTRSFAAGLPQTTLGSSGNNFGPAPQAAAPVNLDEARPALNQAFSRLAALDPAAATANRSSDNSIGHLGAMRFHAEAASPRVNRRATGESLSSVGGVIASPVDSRVVDGQGSVRSSGNVQMLVDPVTNAGVIEASWTDENGRWTYTQNVFAMPSDEASGLRMDTTVANEVMQFGDPVMINAIRHGDTDAGTAELPTVHAYVSTQGPAQITLNGVPFENTVDGPGAPWIGEIEITEGIRNPDGTIKTRLGGFYGPENSDDGFVERYDLELHLTFRDQAGLPGENVPAEHDFFYNVTFEDVLLEMVQADRVSFDVSNQGSVAQSDRIQRQ